EAAVGAAALATRLRRRLAAVAAIDFFGASARFGAESAVAAIEERVRAMSTREPQATTSSPTSHVDVSGGRTWVTRRGIQVDPMGSAGLARGVRAGVTCVTRRGTHVDRMASAWLVRRFIDPAARFKFVSGKGYEPDPGELRFDMFEAEFTHSGDCCTFEVLLTEFSLSDPALR